MRFEIEKKRDVYSVRLKEIELQPIREDSVIEESTTNDRLEKSERLVNLLYSLFQYLIIRGAFVREGIRHADSISSSARSVDC